MDIVPAYSRRSLVMILLFMIFLAALVNGAFYFGMHLMTAKLETATVLAQNEAGLPELRTLLGEVARFQEIMRFYFIPVSAAVFLIFGLLIWLFLRSSVKKLVRRSVAIKKAPAKPVQKAGGGKEKEQHDRRLFLHLFGVLQKEGRLMDFLAEDLNAYDDAQIGAAVRNIHDNCRKAVEKYLAPNPVIDQPEGDEVDIDADFDPSRIKLMGNVTGEPPFKGILRHKGWEVKKIQLPMLSSSQDAKVIAPAEVEIL